MAKVGPSALEPAALNAGRRPRAAVGSGYSSSSIDLTVDDDTLAMPKLDSLERKLRAIEQQLG
jgi:hypothetical protein